MNRCPRCEMDRDFVHERDGTHMCWCSDEDLQAMPIADPAMIDVPLGRDMHLASCDVAKASGPDGTLACAKCGRALWMHGTRHDTCARFCWLTEETVTAEHVEKLRSIPDLSETVRTACEIAFGTSTGAYYIRQARWTCANAINDAKWQLHRQRMWEASRLAIGSSVTIQHQPDRDRGYVEGARAHRRLCDGLTGIVVAEHDSHGLCYEVRLQEGIVVTFDREELELS
jgi:hypothetical protein